MRKASSRKRHGDGRVLLALLDGRRLALVTGVGLSCLAVTACDKDESQPQAEEINRAQAPQEQPRSNLPRRAEEPRGAQATRRDYEDPRARSPVRGAPPGATPSQAQSAAPSGAAAKAIEPEKLDAFAEVYEEVREINEKYSSKIQSASSPKSARSAQQAAAKETAAALDKVGLSVSEYSMLAQAMRNDADIRSRIEKRLSDG